MSWHKPTAMDGYRVCLPYFQRENKQMFSEYRGIALLNVVYKILSPILVKWMVSYAEDLLVVIKCDFTLSSHILFNTEYHPLFVNFKQADENVKRDQLMNALKSV